MTEVQQQGPVRVALIGSGRMGSFHGETLARRLPGAVLAAVADPAPGAAEKLAASLGRGEVHHRSGRGVRRPGHRRRRDRRAGPVPRRPGGGRRRCRQGRVLREADGVHPGRRRSRHRRRPRGRRGAAGRVQSSIRPGLGRGPRPAGRRPVGHAAVAALGHPRPGRFRPGTGRAEHDLHGDPDPRLRRAAVPEPGRDRGRGVRHRNRTGGTGVEGPRPARHRGRGGAFRQRRGRHRRGLLRGVLRVRRPRRGVRLRRHGHHGRRPANRDGVLRRGRRAGRDGPQRPGIAVRRVHRRAGLVRRRRPLGRVGRRHR